MHELLFNENHLCGGINIASFLIELEYTFSFAMQGRHIVNTGRFCCDKEEEGKQARQTPFSLAVFWHIGAT